MKTMADEVIDVRCFILLFCVFLIGACCGKETPPQQAKSVQPTEEQAKQDASSKDFQKECEESCTLQATEMKECVKYCEKQLPEIRDCPKECISGCIEVCKIVDKAITKDALIEALMPDLPGSMNGSGW